MRIAVFPGSFDPPTLGHLDVIRRASNLAARLFVAVSVNPAKSPLFTPEERLEMLQALSSEFPNVEILTFSGLLADLVRQIQADAIIKSCRNSSDFDYENQQAIINKQLCGVDTLFLHLDPKYLHVSSTMAKNIAGLGGDCSILLPDSVLIKLKSRLLN